MSPNAEANMSSLKRLWTKIAHVAKSLEGMDDPTGYYMFSLEKRIAKLERAVEHLERYPVYGHCTAAGDEVANTS
jgi:hypothetical protein